LPGDGGERPLELRDRTLPGGFAHRLSRDAPAHKTEERVHVLVQIGLVAFGSALGGLARWGVAVAFGQLFGTAFPWGTFFINISGSLFLGWFSTMLADRLPEDGMTWFTRDDLHVMIAVGFTGAYTTFSTFEFETFQMIRAGGGSFLGLLKPLSYVLCSVALGFIAVWLGVSLARWK
jgi:CrcB protein